MDMNPPLQLDRDGFLLDPQCWDERTAERLAETIGIRLTEAHWEIVRFIRDYHRRFDHLPNARLFVKAIRKTLGEAKGNNRYLHGLFPGGPLKHACLIAGLPKPPGCL
ncbi:TusE/DsrC/DsvC family sulfur relay protein [Methylococcus geothermalis]|uniref:Sulfurtransferase n=1 Tax=Methylococcus geothermalis TaxID=2681310 RepID=A0A858Q8D8_9GAMM|nr:TusE/DsrC/DsvC family sulfur relay protein [Methylococcus geothermalis]QJD30090.1 TusE/DsrC/DsvC family sulfur relay protein [Methylococcus geothermalis]